MNLETVAVINDADGSVLLSRYTDGWIQGSNADDGTAPPLHPLAAELIWTVAKEQVENGDSDELAKALRYMLTAFHVLMATNRGVPLPELQATLDRVLAETAGIARRDLPETRYPEGDNTT